MADDDTARQHLRIAVLDDDRSQAEAIAQGFRLRGFADVDAVTRGEEIVESFRNYDVLLLDLDLAGEDGIDVAEEVLAAQPDKWIFIFSGNRPFLNRFWQRDLHVSGVFEKPLLQDKMDDLIGQADELAKKRQRRVNEIDTVVDGLRTAARWAATDPMAAQRGLTVAKRSFRDHFLPVSRTRSSKSGISVRRSIVLLIWAALQRLSFVPSEVHRLVIPNTSQLSALADCVELLRKRGLTKQVEDLVDDRLLEEALLPGRGQRISDERAFELDDTVIDGVESGRSQSEEAS